MPLRYVLGLLVLLISSGCGALRENRVPEPMEVEELSSLCTVEVEEEGELTLVLERMDWGGWEAECRRLLPLVSPGPPPYDGRIAVRVETLLEETGYFRTAICEVAEGGRGLECRLDPQPMVTEVGFRGRLPVGVLEEELKRRLLISPGSIIVDEERLREEQRDRLVAFLEREGFFGSDARIRTIPVGGAEPNLGVHIDVLVEVGRSVRLRDVTLEGEHPLREEVVDSRLRRFGLLWFFPRRFQPDRFQDDLDDLTLELRRAGWPEARVSGRWRLDPEEDFVDVVVRADAGPRLAFRFIGNEAISDSNLEDLTTFAEAGIIDETEMERSVEEMERAYQEAGFPDVIITAEADQPDDRTIEVAFVIGEGRRAQIRGLGFEGNEIVSDRRIRRDAEVRTRPTRLIWRGRWVEEVVEADERAIESLYEGMGHAAARVRAERVDRPDGDIDVVFHISEGPRREVETVTIAGLPEEVDDDALMERLHMSPNEPFIEGREERDRNEILTTLASEGYPEASVTTLVDAPRAEEGGAVYIEHLVTPGPLVVIGGFIVRGNFRTRPALIREQLGLEEGEVLDLVSLGEARRRLRALGAFFSVEIEPLGLFTEEPEAWLLVTVQERSPRTLDLVGSYATDEGFAIGGDFRDRNLLGRAIHLDLQLRLGDIFGRIHPALRIGRSDRVDANLRAPRPFGAPFDVDASLFYRFEDQPAFLDERVGGGAGLSRQVLDRETCRFCPDMMAQLRYELSASRFELGVDPEEPEEEVDVPRGILGGPLANIGRITPALVLDRRDSFVDPLRGWAADARFEFAHGWLSPMPEGHNFWRAILNARGYLNMGTPWERPLGGERFLGGPLVLAGNAGFGVARPLAREPGLPDSEALYYGGDYSVRGLAPFASAVAFPGARYRLSGGLELRWYAARNILFGSFQLAAFVDAATVSIQAADIFEEPVVSVGPVLRYITPVGPLSLGWGVAVVRPPSIVEIRPDVIPDSGRLHLTFGYSF